MSKTTTVILLLILIAAGGIILFGRKSAQAPTTNTAPTTTQDQTGNTGATEPSTTTPIIGGTESVGANGGLTFNPKGPNTVEYTDAGFSPASLTVKVGDTVTFVNHSSGKMWVASDPHPTHEGYSGTPASVHCPDTAGTAFDQCSIGNTYTFTFQKVGTWGYHNHTNRNQGGTIIVQ